MIPIPQILALDVGTLVSVIFVVIAFIGWIMNMASSNAQKNQPPRRGPAPPRPQGGGGGGARNDIEMFLQDVTGQRSEHRRPQPPPQDELDDEDGPMPRREAQRERMRIERQRRLEQQRMREQQERQQQAQLEAQRRNEEARREQEQVERQRKKKEAERRRSESRIESSVREHLSGSDEIREHSEDLGHDVAESVESHIGRTFVPAARNASGIGAQLTAMLKNPTTVRQAILVNEVLSKPKSLR